MKEITYKEYQKEYQKLYKDLEARTCCPDAARLIWFSSETDAQDGLTIRMCINISATGKIPPRVASRFADCIKTAAELAEQFKYNGYKVR